MGRGCYLVDLMGTISIRLIGAHGEVKGVFFQSGVRGV